MGPWLNGSDTESVSVTRLIEQFKAGDDEAATRLVHHYFETLRRHAGQILQPGRADQGPSDAAQIAVAEVFSRPGDALSRVSCGDHLMCLLIRRTKDRATDIVRKTLAQKRGGDHVFISLENTSADVIVRAAPDLAPDFQAMIREEITAWLALLDESQCCVVQFVLDGYGIPQIADRFDESEEWVTERYSESLKALGKTGKPR